VWKKWENGKSGPKILTAGETRVTSDERIRIIHDNGESSKQTHRDKKNYVNPISLPSTFSSAAFCLFA
jgi:hypothetical protein